jgi:hypothetical protein
MREKLVCVALVLLAARAHGAPVRALEMNDALPAATPAYESASAAAQASGFAAEPRNYFQTEPGTQAVAEQQSYWPVLYSALMPGLGELTMGYTFRGIALMAVEVAAWSGYFVKHTDGLDKRDEYEAFADAHWTEQKFIDDHLCPTLPPSGRTLEMVEECGQAASGSGGDWWLGYIPYVSKEEDKQHYYENLGKYDWFVSGWSDWDPNQPDPPQPNSALRDQYRAMRADSNGALDDANAFVWVSLAARVFSLAETAIIVHNRRENFDQASNRDENPVALRARPRGWGGGELALEVRFK